MRRALFAVLLLAVPLLSGCSVYAQDAYAYDAYGVGYSGYAVVPGPVYHGGYWRNHGPPPGYYRPSRGVGHRASPPLGFRRGYGRRSGPHGHR